LITPVEKGWHPSAPGDMTEQQFNFLKQLDLDAIEQNQVEAIASYADLWLEGVAPNQPIRTNGKVVRASISCHSHIQGGSHVED
jgi:hypothetical protein